MIIAAITGHGVSTNSTSSASSTDRMPKVMISKSHCPVAIMKSKNASTQSIAVRRIFGSVGKSVSQPTAPGKAKCTTLTAKTTSTKTTLSAVRIGSSPDLMLRSDSQSE